VLFNAGEALEQTRVGFVYSMPLGENQTLTARNYYAWRDFDSMLPSGPGGVVEFDRRFIGGGLTYTYEGVWLDRPNRVVVGFDFDDQDDDRQRFNNLQGVRGDLTFAQNERVKSRGVFIQNELSVTRDLQLTLGLRFDQVDFDVTDHFLGDGDDSGTLEFEDTSPMAGIVYKLGPRTSLYATYSSAFETPTTTELNRPDLLGGFNPNLVPQVARNLEVGARGALGSKSHYEVALFTIDVEDELIGFEVPNNPGRSYYENVGESKRDGIELSFVTNITDNLQTTVSYAYSDFKFTEYLDFSGNRIPGTVQNLLFAELAYRSPKGWFAIGDVTYVDEQFGDNANTVLVPDYTLANLRFGYSVDLGNLELQPFVGVNNLFDETYVSNVRINAAFNRYFEPGPGRNGYAGVTLNWKF
jgi:iron complex outermembrane receptor protein